MTAAAEEKVDEGAEEEKVDEGVDEEEKVDELDSDTDSSESESEKSKSRSKRMKVMRQNQPSAKPVGRPQVAKVVINLEAESVPLANFSLQNFCRESSARATRGAVATHAGGISASTAGVGRAATAASSRR